MRLQDEPFCIRHAASPDEFPQRGIRHGQRNLWHGLCLLGSNRLALRYPVHVGPLLDLPHLPLAQPKRYRSLCYRCDVRLFYVTFLEEAVVKLK